MKLRFNMPKTDGNAYKAMMGLENYLASSSLSATHKELIKIRASQINGCAYCLDMHTREAREKGETERRIYNINTWREAPFYTEQERALLALTEEVTLISNNGVSDATYENAVSLLGEKYVAEALMAIITINAWNRIGVSLHMVPPLD